MSNKFKYYKFYKPFNVLSQFSSNEGKATIADFFNFPKDVYPIGRLDYDSEGLIILSNDKGLVDFLLNPKREHFKEYYVQVEGIPLPEDLEKLEKGIKIREYIAKPARVKMIDEPNFPERDVPIRFRKNIPVSWLSISISEGKNRQVRRMTAAIGFPTLRLIRVKIKNISLGNMKPGDVLLLNESEIRLLKK